MRARRFMRATQAPSLCIFCASRFAGHQLQPSLLASSRRPLHTTRPPNQSAAATAAARAEASNGTQSSAPATPSWDPGSSLTASERAEKERRRQLRLDSEAQAQRKARAEEEENERRQIERFKQREESDRLQAQQREQERIAEMHRRAEEAKRLAVEQEQRHQQELEAKVAERQRRKTERETLQAERRHRDESMSVFRNDAVPSRQQGKVVKVAKPTFAASSDEARSFPSLNLDDDSTSGSGIRPLQYRNETDIEQTNAVQPERSPVRKFGSALQKPSAPPSSSLQSPEFGQAEFGQGSGAKSQMRIKWGSSAIQDHHSARRYDRGQGSNRSTYQGDDSSGRQYQATLVDDAEYSGHQPHQPRERDIDDWQHLPRRNASLNAPPPPPSSHRLQQRTARQQLPDDFIDRAFAEYQRDRRPPRTDPYVPARSEIRNIRAPDSADIFSADSARAPQRCARCLQEGHAARDCPGSPRTDICHRCGQPGHFARSCPQRAGRIGSRNGKPGGDQTTVARQIVPRAVQSTVPWHDEGDRRVRKPFREGRASHESKLVARQTWQASKSEALDADPALSEASSPAASTVFDRRPASTEGRRNFVQNPFGQETATTKEHHDDKSVFFDATPAINRESKSITSATPGEETVELEEKQEERRASRNRRGFEVEEDKAELDVRDDRRSRRSGRKAAGRQDDEDADEAASLREERAARKAARKAAQKAGRAADKRDGGLVVNLPEFISVSQLAQSLGVHYDRFVARLEELGYDDVFPGKVLNAETSGMIAMEYNFDPVFEDSAEKLEEEQRDLKARPVVEDTTFLPTRPPVVTIMGHVDHGKTTILDFLRKSSVAAGEAGGITQHIGAFSVPLSASGKSITFLDTPGHAAFLAMRQRGANVTDIVILVVAADDSVKPQTIESIRCAREAGVPILVAINKVDKEEADVQRVKQDLARNGVEIEDFGGDTQVVEVSGKTGQGMEELEEATVTLSEILDHRAETDGDVEGWVVEATTKQAGRVATVLVKRGTLRPGNVIVAGKTWARVRTLRNEAGQTIQKAGPGTPVEVDGWRDQAVAGDEVLQAPNEQKAGDVVQFRLEKVGRQRTAQDMEAINEARKLEQEKRAREKAEEDAKKAGADTTGDQKPTATASTLQEPGQMMVPFIIKADVSGSAEAVSAYIPSLTSPLIAPQILQSGVGAVHESDIELASAAQGHIIAFNLPADADSKAAAEARGVRILENNIIYRVLDDVKAVLEEKLPPVITQRVLGEAEISATFDIKTSGRKVHWIAGCKIRNGVIGRGSRVRVMRGSEKVYDGALNSLKNVKKDVQEMRKGTECGMGFEDWEGFEVGDQVQTYEEISEKRRL